MTRLWQFWKDEIERQPIILGVLLIFVIACGFNAQMGASTADGPAAMLYAGLFVAFAALGAYAAAKQASLSSGRRFAAWVLIGVQLVVGQMGGWQSLGITLEKGAAKMEDGAAQRGARVDELARLRAERAEIKSTRPRAAIEADERLECSRTSASYKDGVGPKCTGFRVELAQAKRAEFLDARIPALADEIAGGGKVRDASALYQVPAALAGAVASGWSGHPIAVTAEQVRFGWLVFLVASIEIVGILGFWLFGVGHAAPRHHDERHEYEIDPVALPLPPRRMALTGPPPPRGPGGGGERAPTSAASHAPITVNVGVPQLAGPQSAGRSAPGSASEPAIVEPAVLVPQAMRERHDLTGLPADAPPVDRSRLVRALSREEQEAADVLLAFEAACIMHSPGCYTTLAELYQRYRSWAGQRAIAASAFARLWPDVTGIAIDSIGGEPHARHALLRAPLLRAVG